MTFKKKIPLHLKIIAGLIAGLLWGFVANSTGLVTFTTLWIKPFGTIFMNLLQLIAVPLVLASLIKGITSLDDIRKLSQMGTRTIVFYLLTTIIAVSIGIFAAYTIKPGKAFSEEKRNEFREMYAGEVTIRKEQADEVKQSGPLSFLTELFPKNIIKAASENGNMLQVIVFAIFFGVCIVLLPDNSTQTVKKFFSELNDIILKMIEIIMLFAPYGVFALMASVITDFGQDNVGELLKALSLYALTFLSGIAFLIFFLYPMIISALGKVKYLDFIKGILPAQMLAFSTSSSAATLPLTMKCCEENLGVRKEVSGFVLPLGATINMDGTSLYQAVATLFIAQAFGHDLHLSELLTIVLTATLASIGSAAVPGAGMIMLLIVLGSVGIEPEGIALIIAIDRILDMCRTVVNVTGDAVVAVVVNRQVSGGVS